MVGSKRERGKKTEIYRGKDSKRRRTNERGGIERERERERVLAKLCIREK